MGHTSTRPPCRRLPEVVVRTAQRGPLFDCGWIRAFPRLQLRETFTPRTWTYPHPSDEDLSPGTPGVRGDPDMGHPELEGIEAEVG